MKKVTLVATLAVVAMGLVAVIASSAQALPANGTPCVRSGCHATAPVGDPSLIPTVEPTSTAIPTSSPDATRPVSVCNPPASFRGDAHIRLSATDVGWGIGYMYYSLDGLRTHLVRVPANCMSSEVTVTIPAPTRGSAVHTIRFWSQDNYGNVESGRITTVTVNARAAMPMPISVNRTWAYVRHPVVIYGTVFAPGMKVVLWVKSPGATHYSAYKTLTASSARKWSYTATPSFRGYYYFMVTFPGDGEWLASSSTYKRVLVR